MSALAHLDATATELAAQARMRPYVTKVADRVLGLVADAGDAGLTATEAYDLYCAIYGEPRGGYNSIAPRLSYLKRHEHLVDVGDFVRGKRQSYVINAAGRAYLEAKQ